MTWRNVEIINLRVQGIGNINKPSMDAAETVPHEAVAFGENAAPTSGAIALFQRDDLGAGAMLSGEALVFQMDSTTYVPPGWRGQVDAYMNLLLERA